MRSFLIAVILTFAVVPAPAQEFPQMGRMWTFEDLPLELLESLYGFRPEQPWLDHARLSSLRFGQGCSASFISPKGLIITNHHCARASVARVSPPDQDWLQDGFVAKNHESEVPIPGLTVQQLITTEEITSFLSSQLHGISDEKKRTETRHKLEAEMLAEVQREHPGLKPEVVRLYQGGVTRIYVYKIWDDIRLVASPHLQSAKFGGDPDNFTFPRFSLDFALVRAWEGGRPADTSAHYLRFKAEGPAENEPVFVVGNPGSTGRLNTVAQMERLRDASYPIRLDKIRTDIAHMQKVVKENPGEEKNYRANILRYQNARKAIAGYLDGLRSPEIMRQKRELEAMVKAQLRGSPRLTKRFGDVFGRMEEACKELTHAEQVLAVYQASKSRLLRAGILLAQRLDPDSGKRARSRAGQELIALMESWPSVETTDDDREVLVSDLMRISELLPRGDPLREILVGGADPRAMVKAVHMASTIDDPASIQDLMDGDWESLQKVRQRAAEDYPDPVTQAGILAVQETRRAHQTLREKGPREKAIALEVGELMFATLGKRIPPDATFTLRLSDGVVKGFPCNGSVAPWFTSLYGLYARHTEFAGKPPFHLVPEWDAARERLDLKTPFNFVTTNDIIGGNSGSPLLNREGEFVGLVFDGNIESLANRFVFTDEVARTVCVHPRIIILALREILGGAHLADELGGF